MAGKLNSLFSVFLVRDVGNVLRKNISGLLSPDSFNYERQGFYLKVTKLVCCFEKYSERLHGHLFKAMVFDVAFVRYSV